MSLRRALRVSREPFRFVNQRNTRLNNALLLGTVVGTAMEKTVKVEIKRMSLHNALLKYYTKTKRYFAHDPEERCNIGDVVLIRDAKEKKKHWKKKAFSVWEVVERAPVGTDPVSGRAFSRHHVALRPNEK